MLDVVILALSSFWHVLGMMAPYLLLGYLFAGVLSTFVTADTVQKHLGGGSFASTLKAAIFGMPLPLCSCAVIPVTASLRKSGAGKGAVASFLISTPTTGVDSIMAAWALMGPVFAIYRAIMSVVLGVVTGVLVNIFGEDTDAENQEQENSESSHSCCSSGQGNDHDKPKIGFFKKIWSHGFITLPKDLGRPLFVGLLIAGLISALIEADVITKFLNDGIGTMFIMLIVGIPLYVCATASIPLALGFIALGASPGAAFIFLVVGPATNAATLAVLWKMIGKRSTIILLCSLFVGALLGGLLFDFVIDNFADLNLHDAMKHEEHTSWLTTVWIVLLLFVQFWSVYRVRVMNFIRGENVVVADSCCAGGTSEKVEDSCCSTTESSKKDSCCSSSATETTEDSCCSTTENSTKDSCCSGDKTKKSDSCGCGSNNTEKNESSCCSTKKDDSGDSSNSSCGCKK